MTDLSDLSSALSDPALDLQRLDDLRRRAAARLTGTGATKGSIARAADALAVLHDLASSPQTAADALTLLHELQVHQIELDLQAQELIDSRAELEAALRHQVELYDSHPAGCCTIDARGLLLELNQTAAALLGLSRDAACGLPLDAFVCARSAQRFKAALASVDAGACRPSCLLTLRAQDGAGRPMLATIGPDPADAQHYRVNLAPMPMESPETGGQGQGAQTAGS